jgi:hypothetical protein
MFSFSKTSRVALELSQPSIQMVLGFFLVVKQLARNVDPSPPSSTEVKNSRNYTSTPSYVPSWHGQGQFTFSPSLLKV